MTCFRFVVKAWVRKLGRCTTPLNAVGFTRDEKHVLLAAQKLERRPL